MNSLVKELCKPYLEDISKISLEYRNKRTTHFLLLCLEDTLFYSISLKVRHLFTHSPLISFPYLMHNLVPTPFTCIFDLSLISFALIYAWRTCLYVPLHSYTLCISNGCNRSIKSKFFLLFLMQFELHFDSLTRTRVIYYSTDAWFILLSIPYIIRFYVSYRGINLIYIFYHLLCLGNYTSTTTTTTTRTTCVCHINHVKL